MIESQAFGFRIDQVVTPRGRLDSADFRQIDRPGLSCDPQKLERILPVLIECVRDQSVERVPSDAAGDHVVHQPRQVTGQRERRSRAADHKRRRGGALRPCGHQSRKRQPALQLAEFGRKLQRGDPAIGIVLPGEGQLVLVDVAKCDDTGQ